MKAMKKFFALLLAMTMVLAMGTTAFAAGGETGSITIENATAGETYAGYKIFDATVSAGNIAYTIKDSSPFFDRVNAADSPFTLTQINDTDTYTVVVKEGKADYDVLEFVRTLVASATPDLDSQQATSTVVMWDDVPYGYYFITSTLGATVSVTNVARDVVIHDKNQRPGWNYIGEGQVGKNVSNREDGFFSEKNTASQGDTIYYRIYAFMPKYNGDKIINKYSIIDTPDEGIRLNLDSIKVTVNEELMTDGYRVDETGDGGFQLTIQSYDNPGFPDNANIVISFSAEVTGDYSYDRENKASMTWTEFEPSTDDPTVPVGPPEDADEIDTPNPSITHTYVYGFRIQKMTDLGEELDGAEFKLYDAATGGNEIRLVKINDAEYLVPDSKMIASGTFSFEDTIKAGSAKVLGLKEGTYYLEEVKAPDGYNQLTERVAVTVGKTQDLNSDGINDDDVTIVNKAGVVLPETGGIGTTIFYVVGGLLMAGAVVLLITKKKMSANED